jgi:glycosyltransferase involved in cell wall biosynthesis
MFSWLEGDNLGPQKVTVPFPSSSISNIVKNILYSRKNQAPINHVTGDIHYVICAFDKKNLNVLTIHDCVLMYKVPKNSIKYWVYKWLWLDLPVKHASIITTISEKTKQDIIHFTGCQSSKVILIPNYVNPIFKFSEYKFNKLYPTILQIGNSANKNLDRVIEAIKDIPCKLQVIGKLQPHQVKSLKDNKIDFNASFNLGIQEVSLMYRQCDLVVFASTFEGFGMPVIEANQCGRPVVTSNISPIKEVARDSACLVNPLEVSAIRKGILRVIQDDEYRNDLTQKGIQNAKRFQMEQVIQQYVSIYKKLNKQQHDEC